MGNQINPLLQQARDALRTGQRAEAARLLKQAVLSDSHDPRPWLMLAHLAPDFAKKEQCVQQAIRLAPANRHVLKAQAWLEAQQPVPRTAAKLAKTKPALVVPAPPEAAVLQETTGPSKTEPYPVPPRETAAPEAEAVPVEMPAAPPTRQRFSWGWLAGTLALLLLLIGVLFGTSAWRSQQFTTLEASGSVLLLDATQTPAPVAEAEREEAAPTSQPEVPSPTITAEPSATSRPIEPKQVVASAGDQRPLATWTVTPTPSPTATPTPTIAPTYISYSSQGNRPVVQAGEKWIDVNLTNQYLIAYEGYNPIFETYISSGLPQYATVTGQFRIYYRLESQTMDGRRLGFDYVTPNVPHVQYFYGDFALHGAFWHNNFGQQMSHGCVNLSLPDAEWLYEWADYGTLVNVHY